LNELGEDVEEINVTASKPPGGSTDFANVTHAVPGIHPMISIASEGVKVHTKEFAEATLTDTGHRGLEIGAKTMAMAAVEILIDNTLLEEMKNEHCNSSK
jgi:metal-dependent amidase/aminoacylase/carboxypeptidase family protein